VPGVMIFYGFKIKGVARHAKKSTSSFSIFLQNIGGLSDKYEELYCSLKLISTLFV
jgi:hypothetical protein